MALTSAETIGNENKDIGMTVATAVYAVTEGAEVTLSAAEANI